MSEDQIDDILKSLEDVTVNYNLMITEDEEDYRYLIEHGFKQVGFSGTINSTKNGQDLLDYLKYENNYAKASHPLPDFILLDMRMPKLDGRQTLLQIKGDEKLRKIPVIIFTANQIEGEDREMIGLGAEDYIRKPNSSQELKPTFKAILNHWLKVISD